MVFLQDPSAILDWTQDWSDKLAANGNATITAATVTGPAGVTITNKTVTTTSVTWRLTINTVPSPPVVPCVVHVTLSTGEEDERTTTIQVTNL